MTPQITALEQLSGKKPQPGWPWKLRLKELELYWFGASFCSESLEQRLASLQTCVLGVLKPKL